MRFLATLLVCLFILSSGLSATERVEWTVSVGTDWTLVSIPLTYDDPFALRDLVAEAGAQGVAIDAVATLVNGKWLVYIPGLPFNGDRPVSAGEGFLLLARMPGQFSLIGRCPGATLTPTPFVTSTPFLTPTPLLTATPQPTQTPLEFTPTPPLSTPTPTLPQDTPTPTPSEPTPTPTPTPPQLTPTPTPFETPTPGSPTATPTPITPTQRPEDSGSFGASSDEYGHAVAMDGNVAFISAWRNDEAADNAGVVYIYNLLNDRWVFQERLFASDPARNMFFGASLDIDGDTAAIGAYGDDDNGLESGSVYIYTFDGTSWVEQQKLTASDGDADDLFGWDVSVDAENDTVAIGAKDDSDRRSREGSVYIFTRNGAGVWSEATKLYPSYGTASGAFGQSVTLDGGQLYIGAPNFDQNTTVFMGSAGAVWPATGSGGAWTVGTPRFAPNPFFGAGYGYSVDMDDQRVIVGAIRDAGQNGFENGAAYIYTRGGFGLVASLPSPNSGSSEQFGSSVSIDGDYAVIGAFANDIIGTLAGRAYVYVGPAWFKAADLAGADTAFFDRFGFSVANSGTRALVGAPQSDRNAPNAGAAYFYNFAP